MKRVACLIGLLIATPLVAQEPVEREHVVKRGDTLWDLAGSYYSNPFDWPTIYEANTTVVEDPHWIYPNEVLVIPGIRGDTEPAPQRQQVAMQRPAPEPPARTVFYRQPPTPPAVESSDPTVLSEPVMMRVPVRAGVFMSAPFVDDPGNLEIMGEFIGALRENRVVGSPVTAHPRDEIYLGYEGDTRPELDQRLLLIRVGKRMAGDRLLEPTGVVRVTRLADEVIFAQIETQYGPILPGQVAVRMPMYPDFVVEEPQPVAGETGYDLEGEVIEIMGDPPLPGLGDVGFVDRGAGEGVQVGDVFTAYLPERASRSRGVGDFLSNIEELPTEDVARLLVVRVGPDVATVRVDRLMLPRLEAGIQVRRTHTVQVQ